MNEWPLHLFSSLLFKPAYHSPLWKGSSVITLNKTSIPLSNEKITRPFSSSLKSAIQSQCGALKKLNPLTLKRIDQEFDLGSARSDPCLLNSCTPGYVCWENPRILPCGREGRKKANTNTKKRFMRTSKKGDRERGTGFPSIKQSLPIHSMATDRRQFCRCC